MRDADTAMYRSKAAGRNTITCFGLRMRQQVERRVELERDMRIAFERGEIVPFFQPLVALPAGQMRGVRGAGPLDGADAVPIPPSEFVPVAEESGLIVAARRERCSTRPAAARRMAGARCRGAANAYVSVNMSVRQVLESEIVDVVAETLERWDLPDRRLRLEITESVLMEDTIETQAVLDALCATSGSSLSVDDFGTGFSSLSYLKPVPGRQRQDRQVVRGRAGRGGRRTRRSSRRSSPWPTRST